MLFVDFSLMVSFSVHLCTAYTAQDRAGRLNDSRISEALSAQGKARERAEAENDSLRAEVTSSVFAKTLNSRLRFGDYISTASTLSHCPPPRDSHVLSWTIRSECAHVCS